jgi:hypothetical protein
VYTYRQVYMYVDTKMHLTIFGQKKTSWIYGH